MATRGTWAAVFLALFLTACGDEHPPGAPEQVREDVKPAEEAGSPPAFRRAPPAARRSPTRTFAEELLARYDAEPRRTLNELAEHGMPVVRKLLGRMAETKDEARRARAFDAVLAIFRAVDRTLPGESTNLEALGLPLSVLIEEGEPDVARLSWVLLANLPLEASRHVSGARLMEALRHDQPVVRRFAIDALVRLGAYAPEGAEDAVERLKSDADSDVRTDAVVGLRNLKIARKADDGWEPPQIWCGHGMGLLPREGEIRDPFGRRLLDEFKSRRGR